MSIFVKSTLAPKPRSKESSNIAIFFAAVLVLMAVAQLFTFEDFLPYIQSLNLPLSDNGVYSVAPILIFAEIFAVPFLLRMRLSPAFRFVSMLLGWLSVGIWLFISVWILVANVDVDTIGFLGTVVDLTPGWWAVFISLALGVLAAWSAWGLWPGKRTK
ncbi:MAG: rane protein of unknown function [Candidatus Saccharibacteria bacterium]|nr:rane protein of unknown function [Candidatus Saccharibacteria bacterium]